MEYNKTSNRRSEYGNPMNTFDEYRDIESLI